MEADSIRAGRCVHPFDGHIQGQLFVMKSLFSPRRLLGNDRQGTHSNAARPDDVRDHVWASDRADAFVRVRHQFGSSPSADCGPLGGSWTGSANPLARVAE